MSWLRGDSQPPPRGVSSQQGAPRQQQRLPPPPEQSFPSKLRIVDSPNDAFALSNRIAASSSDFPNGSFVIINDQFIFTVASNPNIEPSTLGIANHQRRWSSLVSGDILDTRHARPFNPREALGNDYILGSLTLEIDFLSAKKATDALFEADALAKFWWDNYDGLLVSAEQPLIFSYNRVNFKAVVKQLTVVELQLMGDREGAPPQGKSRSARAGIIVKGQTEIGFVRAEGSPLRLRASEKRAAPNAIIQPDFKFEDMGIGGLDNEFSHIFRRAFASRIFPPGLVEKLGISHVKGILLFGPPGTGKTLIARQIGKMLNAKEPKIVNGPEVLNKFVGASEENIRKLFADAEKEYKAKGDESSLHIIIFDELDAICKQRGSGGAGSTGVGDSVVNQLLSKMDGVDQLNNILIIGMTNRIDMIDEALLRPGRLEMHLEISLPDEKGRIQILKIHTNKMRQNNLLERDVDVLELAALTKNYSGAEINGLVRNATSYAFSRHVKVGTQAGISDDVDKLKICRADFMHALEEVKPAFGAEEDEIMRFMRQGIIHYDSYIDEILDNGRLYIEQVKTSQQMPLVSVLIHGPPASGKTALAASMASSSEAPFIKLISAEQMVGFSDTQKIHHLNKTFSDSSKSALSVLVVDSIERIIDWVPMGARFSNPVLQALMNLINTEPPKERRLLVLATTSNLPMLADMEMVNRFTYDIRVPSIDKLSSVMRIVVESGLFGQDRRDVSLFETRLKQAGLDDSGKFSIGVKKLLALIDKARLVKDPVEQLASELIEAF